MTAWEVRISEMPHLDVPGETCLVAVPYANGRPVSEGVIIDTDTVAMLGEAITQAKGAS